MTVGIVVDPKGSSVDTVRAVVEYPANMVSITSFAQSGYMDNKSPSSSYNNTNGTLSWGGFTTEAPVTAAGTFGTITFKALSAGTATIAVGAGSHIIFGGAEQLAARGSVTIVIADGAKPSVPPTPAPAPSPSTPPLPVTGAPRTPSISSSSHPDRDAWYSNNDPVFSWSLEGGVTGVNITLDRSAWTDPGTKSDGLFSSHTYTDIADGVWFFHIKTFNEKGWSPVTHYRIQIDATPPIAPEVLQESSIVQSQARFSVNATDSLSGIQEYIISIDDQKPFTWTAGGSRIYTTPDLEAGKHTITFTAKDAAGNTVSRTISFTIGGPSISIREQLGMFASDGTRGISDMLIIGTSAIVAVGLILLAIYLEIIRRRQLRIAKILPLSKRTRTPVKKARILTPRKRRATPKRA